ncbi:hypothetical protein tb265_06470 [Gemmatimonadetes bacterium T265]|nr:hypothetical protein tb265_06470 [Gemmatimonadetes bacterium T265]
MSYVLSSSISPRSVRAHSVWVGLNDNRIIVRGTSGRDIDCWVYDDAGRLVDTDETSVCVLDTPGVGTHQLVVQNNSDLSSHYTVWQNE